jgi:hypothetical protein
VVGIASEQPASAAATRARSAIRVRGECNLHRLGRR